MITIHPYLNFNGNCYEAFTFYKTIFGGEFSYVGRFADMPTEDGQSIPEELKDLIMHMSLPINDKVILMGSDVHESFGQKVVPGSNVELMITLHDRAETNRIWEALRPGATIVMDLHDAFWGDYFGNLMDRFGIRWSLNCPSEASE